MDAINEPDRPIPSGRIPGRWGLYIALVMSAVALVMAVALGPWGFGATVLAVAFAWAYSAEPVRAKRSGWWGPGLVGISYESLPWITGAAVMIGGGPSWQILLIALLYGLGAHGIMTLNDFKAIEGDRQTGVASLPVTLGPDVAARVACIVMVVPQILVAGLLWTWGAQLHAGGIVLLMMVQGAAMPKLLRDPRAGAPFYNGPGVGAYVTGMMVAAFALRGMGA